MGKKMFYKRSVMIALAVVALLTITAGVAAADSLKAKFTATGSVAVVALPPGGVVESEFKIKKNGDIKSIKVHTDGELVIGGITTLEKCKGECGTLAATLLGVVTSTHISSAKLKVTHQPGPHPYLPFPFEVVGGKLKGKLEADLNVAGTIDTLDGDGNLKIKGTGTSFYGCFTGLTATGFDDIQKCVDAPGPHSFIVQTTGPPAGPVMLAVELHVKDSGKFEVEGEIAEIKGKISVTVDGVAEPFGSLFEVPIVGDITVKGKAEFGD